jgi:hypothetical protein
MQPKPKRLPFFPLYVNDFIADTQDLTDEELGAYFRILMTSWNKGPLELKRVRRLVDDFDNVWPEIQLFFIEENGMIWNNRMEKERIRAQEKHQSAVDRGIAGAESRWGSGPANSPVIAKPIAKPIATQNSEHTALDDTPSELIAMKFIRQRPKLIFPNLTIPRMLEIVYSMYGKIALEFMLDKIESLDQDVRYKPKYVRKVIDNSPLLKIKNGEADANGYEVKAYTKEEALKWCDRNGVKMSDHFGKRNNKLEKFEDGSTKFFLKGL